MIYWVVLIILILLNKKIKKDGMFYLRIGFYLFLTGALISIVGIEGVAEFFMRICLVFLLVGFSNLVSVYLKNIV